MRTAAVQCRRSLLSPPQLNHPGSTWQQRSNDMDGSHHMGAVTELDLSAGCHPNTIVDRINAMPGLKTSTAFFTFLRANLVLPHSAMSSNVSTPYLEPHAAPPHSPSPLAAEASSATLDDIPPLSLDILTKREDRVDALKLVADSVAQQRQQSSFALVTHPLLLATLAAVLGGIYQYSWTGRKDLGTFLMLLTGTVMTYLVAIRYLTSPYLSAAEAIRWDWLVAEDGEEDVVIGTRFGDEVIAALVLRLEPNPSVSLSGNKKKNRSLSLKGGKGVIRAWTTRLRYRGKGVGEDMLYEAVRITRERCGRDAEVGFAREHANSVRVLPDMFNGVFRRQEIKAAKALEAVVAGKRKR